MTVDELMRRIVAAHGGVRKVAARAVGISAATILNRLRARNPKPETRIPAPEVDKVRRAEDSAAAGKAPGDHAESAPLAPRGEES